MAKTKLAAPLAGIRGTVGGLTYSANGSGTFVKAWSPPSNPQTPPQMTERSYLALMPGLWNALSSAQRTGWDTFAALPAQELFDSLGQSYFASGWNWFCKCNVRLLRVGRSTISAAPVIARPAAPSIDALTVTIAGTDTDLCAGGAASASASDPSYPPANAFDDNTGTFWQSPAASLPVWLAYTMPATQVITKFGLYFPTTTLASAPRDFVFRYWSGAAWIPLFTKTLFYPPTAGWHYFSFYNTTSATFYSLYISVPYTPGTGYATVHEMAFFTGLVDNSRILYPPAEFSSGPYDLVLKISMVNSQSRSVQYPGYYEILATQAPGDNTTSIQIELAEVFGTILEGRRWFAQLYRQTSEGIRSAAVTTSANTETP